MAVFEGKTWSEMTEDEHRRFPGDYEAQSTQGSIPAHSDEHLAGSDKGLVMLRRLLARQIRVVQEGGDPEGTGGNNPGFRSRRGTSSNDRADLV